MVDRELVACLHKDPSKSTAVEDSAWSSELSWAQIDGDGDRTVQVWAGQGIWKAKSSSTRDSRTRAAIWKGVKMNAQLQVRGRLDRLRWIYDPLQVRNSFSHVKV